MSRFASAWLAALALACSWHGTAAGGEGATAPPGWVAIAGGGAAGEKSEGWSLELSNAPLRDVLEQLARDCGFALEAGRQVGLERRVSLSAHGGEPEITLHHVLRATGLVLLPAAPGVLRVARGGVQGGGQDLESGDWHGGGHGDAPGPEQGRGQEDPQDLLQENAVAIVTGTASLLIDLPADTTGRKPRAATPPSDTAAGAATAAGPAPSGVRGAQLDWKIRPRSRVGSNFTVQVFLRSERPAASVPLTIAFDRDALEVVRIDAGDVLGAQPVFSSHIDAGGVITLQGARSAAGGGRDQAGLLASITFRANRAAEAATIQVTSARVLDAAGTELPTVIPFRHSMPVLP